MSRDDQMAILHIPDVQVYGEIKSLGGIAMRNETTKVLLALFAFALIAASCGGGSSDNGSSDATPEGDESAATPENNESAATETPAAPPPGVSSGGTAVITLENGEVFEFSILCALEPQPNFEYSIVSYDNPNNLDISKWSEDSGFNGTILSIYDSTSYETIWEASSNDASPGGGLDLSINGSTLSGSGLFWPAGDVFGDSDGVQGEILANC